MEMLQLRYFFESAKNGSFAKTAKKYEVPSTSVSAAIKRLEDELGCRLFDRECNRIVLNESGKRLQKSLLVVFDELERVATDLSGEREDTREIRMLVRAMRSKITDAIIEYKEQHPGVVFKTVFDFEDVNVEDFDIIIEEKNDNMPEYEGFELCSTRLKLRASQKSPLCKKKLTLKQLENEAFVSMGENNDMQKTLTRACQRAGFSPNVVVQSNDILCFERCIKAGIGIGVTRARDPYPASGTAYLNVVDFDDRYTVYGYYKKQAYYGNIKNFIDFLKTQAE